MAYRSVYGYIWQLVDTSYLIRFLREFLRTRLLPISSWGDSVLEKSTMGGTVVSICIMFSPPLTHLLINPLTLWKILPFSETNMQIVQPSLPSWPCMAFASYSSSLIDLFCNISAHTHLINTHEYCDINNTLAITHSTFACIRCDVRAQRRHDLTSSFDALLLFSITSLSIHLSHINIKHLILFVTIKS